MKNLKYLFLLPILTLFIGCEAESTKVKEEPATTKIFTSDGHRFYKVTVENHDYLYMYNTSLVHSESCSCKGNK